MIVLVEYVKNLTKYVFIFSAGFKRLFNSLLFENTLIKSAKLVLDEPKENLLRILTEVLE